LVTLDIHHKQFGEKCYYTTNLGVAVVEVSVRGRAVMVAEEDAGVEAAAVVEEKIGVE
jgi:hypothetical protein